MMLWLADCQCRHHYYLNHHGVNIIQLSLSPCDFVFQLNMNYQSFVEPAQAIQRINCEV